MNISAAIHNKGGCVCGWIHLLNNAKLDLPPPAVCKCADKSFRRGRPIDWLLSAAVSQTNKPMYRANVYTGARRVPAPMWRKACSPDWLWRIPADLQAKGRTSVSLLHSETNVTEEKTRTEGPRGSVRFSSPQVSQILHLCCAQTTR